MSGLVPVVVGLSDEYSRSRVENALRERKEYSVIPLEELPGGVAAFKRGLLWLEYEDLPFETLAHHLDDILVNSYCIRKGLIRKSQMAYAISKYVSKHEDSVLKKAVPETYLFELDDPYYFEEAMNDVFEVAAELKENEDIEDPKLRKRWILKPSITNKGAEIFIFDTEEQLRNMFEERYEKLCGSDEDEDGQGGDNDGAGNLSHIREWVMQRYLANPLCLYGGRKFHIRTYVVAVGNIRVFVYREMLALFAALPYDREDLSSTCHITNTCVQAADPSFVESESVRRFWDMTDALPAERLEQIFGDIKTVIGEVFASVAHEVTVFQPLRNMFELYGLDFLVDEDFGVHFLEANAFPDFRQTGEQLGAMIDNLFRQTVSIAVDPFFKVESQPAPDLHQVLELHLRSSARP